MRLIATILFMVFSGVYACTGNAATPAAPTKQKTAETRKKQAVVSKSLLAKLKAQALNEARAELALIEAEARERAKLEALQELDAVANDTLKPCYITG